MIFAIFTLVKFVEFQDNQYKLLVTPSNFKYYGK